ncbi:MAG TPA: hypothetical protein VE170_03270, partial [Candidatus Limnocylindria bacterium]|nr:hypothetical protein [Candidatus Limnocylindria bacterium]
MLQPSGLVSGHYECRSFAESLPILKEFLALSVVDEKADEKILQHPNTGWQLVVHANGSAAPIKSMRNHYGVRVATNAEVDTATEYLESRKNQFGIKVIKPRENHNAYSVHFYEPGGNYWEIESYEDRHKAGLPFDVSFPWKTPLTEEQFPGRGYVPQAFTHGTIECNDWASSVNFYKQGLGMDVITHIDTPKPHNIKHPAKPWYVVSLEVPEKNRKYLGLMQR